MEKLLFKTNFGSHLYGTDTPASDRDYKGVFVPGKRELLLQTARRVRTSSTRPPDETKNAAGDEDTEVFALHEYVKLLLEGQTVALDMMFAPEQFWINRSSAWRDVIATPTAFLSKNCAAYVGYCQKQAAKYGVKGSRVAAVRRVLESLKFIADQGDRMSGHDDYVRGLASIEHVSILELPSHKDGPLEPFLEVCNRKFAFHLKVGYVVDCLAKILGEYGQRALLAEKNEGIDWKALSHAVRVCDEAKQLLRYHTITFPLETAGKLKDIKLGRYRYQAVAEMIEQGLLDLEKERELSTLPDAPDAGKAWDLVYDIYRREAE